MALWIDLKKCRITSVRKRWLSGSQNLILFSRTLRHLRYDLKSSIQNEFIEVNLAEYRLQLGPDLLLKQGQTFVRNVHSLVTLRYGDKGTIRRMGALLEREGIKESLLVNLEKAVPPSTSFIPWIPTKPKRGTSNRRWGVVLNGD